LIFFPGYGKLFKEVSNLNSPLLEKSLDFATNIVLFYEAFSKTRRDTTIAKQLLRSATSIGANINEAVYGNSKADFIARLHIALKETGESIYWLTLLSRTNLFPYDYGTQLALAEEIKRMLIASLNTAKSHTDK
jgi:four helix bundle protein